jgi:CMP/dCMP kinase
VRVIAIDGPAGSGKSTVGRMLAERLGLTYLDTGAMYRAVAFAAILNGVDPTDLEPVAALARSIELEVGESGVVIDGVDATIEIRGPEVSRAVSHVAANPGVRDEMRARQRLWADEHGGGVIEGRDIGSVVFPDATLTADPEVRAQRRAAEMGDVDAARIAADIERRDAMDRSRADSPLVTPDGAVTVDTTGLSIDEVLAMLESMVEERTS